MFTDKKKLALLLMVLSIMWTFVPGVLAAPSASSADQIVTQGNARYYDLEGEETTAAAGDAVVEVTKTARGTDVENEFQIQLDVNTTFDIASVPVSPDAAVVLTFDISDSMSGNNVGRVNHMDQLKEAAENFLLDYADATEGAKRYISLVVFAGDARIDLGWIDVADETNLSAAIATVQGLMTPAQEVSQLGRNTLKYGTNLQGGLQLARNLFRTDALPNGNDNQPIENRFVVLFSDGAANSAEAAPRYNDDFPLYRNAPAFAEGTFLDGMPVTRDYYTFFGGEVIPNNELDSFRKSLSEGMADSVKRDSEFYSWGTYYDKMDNVRLFTVAFNVPEAGTPDQDAWAQWLGDAIATDQNHAFTADTSEELNNAFSQIVEDIESWAEAWILTDPMADNITFNSEISALETDKQFTDNTLVWDLKETLAERNGNLYSYRYTYDITLDTAVDGFEAETPVPTNNETTLTYKMRSMINGILTYSPLYIADFNVPTVKGFGGILDFMKQGGDGASLAGCEFTLTNLAENKADHDLTAVSQGADGTLGLIDFTNIPSGYSYTLSETDMAESLRGQYIMNDQTYTVSVRFGEVTVTDEEGETVSDGFSFVNPLAARTVVGYVWPIAVSDYGFGQEFLSLHDTVVELRPSYWEEPVSDNLSVVATEDLSGNYNAETGCFTFEDVPFGTYLLYIQRPGYLTRCLEVHITPESDAVVVLRAPQSTDGVFEIWAGDPNDNGLVEQSDMDYLERAMNHSYGDPYYEEWCDFNADGMVNATDENIYRMNAGLDLYLYPGAEGLDLR